jgi:dTDP-4-amino-4,6-dideoxygalactose transaminase
MTSHRETAYRNHEIRSSLSVSEDASDNSIVLPLYVPMSEEEINYVLENLLLLLK